MKISITKKLLTAALALLVASAAQATTFVPVGLLNPTGSSAGQVVVSAGPATAPGWGKVSATSLAAQAANTVVANVSASSASPTAFAMPSCSATGNALGYTSGTGWTCLTGYAPIANPTFTGAVTIPSGASISGYLTTATASATYAPLASPALTGTPTAPTAALGTNTTQIATTAAVVANDPCPSILDYGGQNLGTVDNTAAFASTAAASPSGHACVYFPPGIYLFSSAVSYTLPSSTASITIEGAGAEVSQLYWPTGSGVTINEISQYNSTHVHGLSFLTGAANSGHALEIVQGQSSVTLPAFTAPSDISDSVFRGFDGYVQTDYWNSGVAVSAASNINLFNDIFVGSSGATGGIGMEVFGTSTQIPVAFNFVGDTFISLGNGILYGDYAQGVQVTSSNFTENDIGIQVPSGETGLDELAVTNSQFETTSTGTGINIASGVASTNINNSLFIVASGSSANGMVVGGCANCQITGNSFVPASTSTKSNTGIEFTGNSTPTSVSGNTFSGFTDGVYIGPSGTGINVQSNSYSNNTTNVGNAGSGNTIGGGSQ